MNPLASKRSGAATRSPDRGFTLIELLTVIAIIGILAAIIIPTVGKVRSSARTSLTVSNLRQIGMALNLYTSDQRGLLPASQSNANDGTPGGPAIYWTAALNPYVGKSKNDTNSDISSFFICPVYVALIGREPLNYKGGYAMNNRIAFINGPWNYATDDAAGNRLALSRFTSPSRTIFASFGVDEAFSPNNDGTRPDEVFFKADGQTNSTLVPHNRRIGADSNGKNGSSAAYLYLDGSVRVQKPEDVIDNLKRIY